MTLGPGALGAGRRRLCVVLADALGNTSTPEWTFDVKPGGAVATSDTGALAKPVEDARGTGATPLIAPTPGVAPSALTGADGKPAAKPAEDAAAPKAVPAETAQEAPSGTLSRKTLLIFGGAGVALVGLLALARKK